MRDTENNMDDLFRRASENYSPDTGESNWHIIKPQLQNNSGVTVIPILKKKKRKAFPLILFFVIASGVLSYDLVLNTPKKLISAANHAQAQHKKNTNPISFSRYSAKHDINNKMVQENIILVQSKSVPIDNYFLNQNASEIKANKESDNAGLLSLTEDAPKPIPVKQQEENKIFLQVRESINVQEPKSKIIAIVKPSAFYAGILSGVSLNQVKSQGYKKLGYSIGVIAGYKISKNIAVEGGLLYSKKFYFSDGKYFNMEKMPANMKVISLTGSCNVFEIPVNIKYDVLHKNNAAVFASAGISSYLLTKESNDYVASINGTPQNLKGLYKNFSADFASAVNLSAGYEHTIGKNNNIRIQPYAQIPLKGTGVGKMQVMSTGVNIAITHAFH